MSHYANVVDGLVVNVIRAEADFIAMQEGEWIQCSYNTRAGVHYGQDGQPDSGVALRANFAGVGYTYDQGNDVFYVPKPYPSWTISGPDWIWKAPVAMPTDGKRYRWDEPSGSWIKI